MNIILLKLSEIKPNPDNPRLIKDYRFDKLVKSIIEMPEMLSLRPIILDNDSIALAGNMRYKALQHLASPKTNITELIKSYDLPFEREIYLINYWDDFKKVKTAPVMFAKDLTDEQKKEFIIKDNVSFGEMDWDILANNFEAFDLNDWGLDMPVFESAEEPENKGEIDTNEFEDEAILKLKFDFETYGNIMAKLSELEKTPEEIMLNALGF